MKWEYIVVYVTGILNDVWEGEIIHLEEYLNKKGKEGWELVQGPGRFYNCCIFKRLIK
jgi:hypothetical protein